MHTSIYVLLLYVIMFQERCKQKKRTRRANNALHFVSVIGMGGIWKFRYSVLLVAPKYFLGFFDTVLLSIRPSLVAKCTCTCCETLLVVAGDTAHICFLPTSSCTNDGGGRGSSRSSISSKMQQSAH